jgi:hypothetical protein
MNFIHINIILLNNGNKSYKKKSIKEDFINNSRLSKKLEKETLPLFIYQLESQIKNHLL